MNREHWSGGFIDQEDPGAVERWARDSCRGLSVEEAATRFETEPTIAAIAKEVASGFPEATRKAAQRACEAELRKANRRT